MVQFMQLPGYQSPQALNFEPLTNSLRFNAQNALAQDQMTQQNNQFMLGHGLDKQRLALSQAADSREAAMAPLRIKQLSQAIDLARQQGATAQMLAPLEIEMKRAQVNLYNAQAKAAGQKDAMDELFLSRFRNSQPPASGVQSQSFDGALSPVAPMAPPVGPLQGRNSLAPSDPNIIPTQAAPAQRPTQPSGGAGDEMVDVPMLGRVTRSQAREMAGFLAYRGKGDLAKMIMDASTLTALGKDVRGDVDKAEFKATEIMGRMKAIKEGFQKEFLTFEEQAKQFGVSFADKFDTLRAKLPPEVLQRHAEYTAFRRDTVENLNRYINEVTGAAMGVEEAKRLSKAVPTMDDGPTAFKAKMDGVIKQTQLAIARYRYLRSEGFNGQPWAGNAEDAAKTLPLDRMGSIIRDQSEAVLQQLREQNPKATDEQLRGATRAVIRQMFGIDA